MSCLKINIKSDKAFTESEALAVLKSQISALPGILDSVQEIRRDKFKNKVKLCSIINARSGKCSQDCSFCAQSSRHQTTIETYPLLENKEIFMGYNKASKLPIDNFGIVTSGKALTDKEISRICDFLKENSRNPEKRISCCASFGMLNSDQFKLLKKGGLKRYHHNLETAESYFPNICTTHTYKDRVRTVLAAKEAGLEVCSGGLFGLGEGLEERVELAFALKELKVNSIPLNFLVPIPDTPAAKDSSTLTPHEILKTIAMFRLVCREEEIKVCAGREVHLGDFERDIFKAGASGMLIGGYLTVRGRSVEEDLELIDQAGMET